MKQRITPDQPQQLTPSQQEKLRAWWKPQRHDVPVVLEGGVFYEQDAIIDSNDEEKFYFPDDCDYYVGVEEWHDKTNYLPLLNIGQCIEILREYDIDALAHEFWQLAYGIEDNHFDMVDELLDGLWDAVKSIL